MNYFPNTALTHSAGGRKAKELLVCPVLIWSQIYNFLPNTNFYLPLDLIMG